MRFGTHGAVTRSFTVKAHAMSCLDDNTLFELSLGQLSPAELAAAESHLDGCPSCRRLLAQNLRTSAARGPKPPPVVNAGTAVGRYLVIERVGAGAMGQVFSAYDPQLDRKIALKLLRPGSSTDEHRARLAREAQTLARLSHPNVVTVFDVGTWEGQLFMALEFVPAGSARTWLTAKPRTWREIVALYSEAGRGLAAAHDAGVVHRDFKPDNVLVRADGRPQVTDFGLAAENPSAPSVVAVDALTLTHTDAVMGTPAYMAADQLEGTAASFASDQFSFCATLFEALTGGTPFEGQSVQALLANLRAGKTRAFKGDVPPRVRRVIARGLSADAQSRFPSMTALLDALDSAVSRRINVALGIGAALLGVVLAGVVVTQKVSREPACVLAEERQLAAWNPNRASEVKKTFDATGLSYADKAFTLVDSAVRTRVDSWRPRRAEACEAVTGRKAAPVFEAQLRCLDERWAELEATLQVLGAGGPEVVNQAVRIVEKLPGAQACTEPAVLERYGATPGACEACVADQAQVAKTRALFEAGKFAVAREWAESALDGGVSTAPAKAAMVFERARALEELGQLDDAEVGFFQSGLEAQRTGDGLLGATSWVELAYLVGYLRSRPDEGLRWAEQGEALAALQRDGRLADRFASVRGSIATRRGKLDEAATYFAQAEQLLRSQYGAAHPLRLRALMNWASAQLHGGNVKEALPKLEEGWKWLSSALGEDHPDAFKALNALGAGYGLNEQYEAALPVFERVLAGYKKTLGASHPRIGTAAGNLGEAEQRLGRYPEALVHFAEASAVYEKTGSPLRATTTLGEAEVLLALNRADEALKRVELSLAICAKAACEPLDEGQIHLGYAKALHALNRSPAVAVASAQKALVTLKALGPAAAKQTQAARDFLAQARQSSSMMRGNKMKPSDQ